MSSICALLFLISAASYLLYRFLTKAPVPPDLELEAIILATPPQEPSPDDANTDEHAEEFAETLEKLESGEIQTSDYVNSEYADIIDEEEVARATVTQAVGGFIAICIWIFFEIVLW